MFVALLRKMQGFNKIKAESKALDILIDNNITPTNRHKQMCNFNGKKHIDNWDDTYISFRPKKHRLNRSKINRQQEVYDFIFNNKNIFDYIFDDFRDLKDILFMLFSLLKLNNINFQWDYNPLYVTLEQLNYKRLYLSNNLLEGYLDLEILLDWLKIKHRLVNILINTVILLSNYLYLGQKKELNCYLSNTYQV